MLLLGLVLINYHAQLLFSFQSTNIYGKVVTVLGSWNATINKKYSLLLTISQSGRDDT